MVKRNSISICILRLSSIGDVTHIIPIISSIRNAYQNSKITWVIGKTEYELVKNLKDIDFILVDKRSTINSLVDMRNSFKNRNFDIVFHMQKSLRSKLIANIIKGKINVTFNDIDTQGSHVLDHFFAFLDKVNIKKRILDWQVESIVSKHNEYLKDNNINKQKPFLTMNPFTSSRPNNYREWSYDNFATISEYCKNQYSINTVILGKTSKEKASKIKKYFNESSHVINLINQTSLGEMLCVLNQSEFYIGPDSGTLHMARMVEIPVIGLYATSNPHRTGPYKKLDYVVDKYNEALCKFSDKNINNAKWGERVRDPDAMKLISINDVKSKIKDIVKTLAF